MALSLSQKSREGSLQIQAHLIPVSMPISTDTQKQVPHTLPGKWHPRVWEKLEKSLPIYDISGLHLWSTHGNTCPAPGWIEVVTPGQPSGPLRQSQQVPHGEPQLRLSCLRRKPHVPASAPNSINYWFANAGGSRRERVLTGATNHRKEINFQHEPILHWRFHIQP